MYSGYFLNHQCVIAVSDNYPTDQPLPSLSRHSCL